MLGYLYFEHFYSYIVLIVKKKKVFFHLGKR